MPSKIDIIGRRFGRLTVMEEAEPIVYGDDSPRPGRTVLQFIARCDCGASLTVRGYNLHSGHTISCGCFRIEESAARETVHGDAGRNAATEYRAWSGMISRCGNPASSGYEYYGGRGIAVCVRWREGADGKTGYECFLDDMGRKPTRKHEIDRKDNDGPYAPANCRWVTRRDQQRNRSDNHLITYNGRTMPLVAWAEETGIQRSTISRRIEAGWSVHKALSEPVRVYV